MLKRCVLTLLSLLIFVFPVAALEPGADAPDFALKDIHGRQIRLSDFKGQPVILKLATTWCPTCKQQTQEVKSVAEELKKRNVAYVEIFLQDSPEMVSKFLNEADYPMPHAFAIDDGQVYKAYGVYVIPRVLLVDKDMKVRKDGSLTPARELLAELDRMGAPR